MVQFASCFPGVPGVEGPPVDGPEIDIDLTDGGAVLYTGKADWIEGEPKELAGPMEPIIGGTEEGID